MPLLQFYAELHGFSMDLNDFYAFSMILIDSLEFPCDRGVSEPPWETAYKTAIAMFRECWGDPAAVF